MATQQNGEHTAGANETSAHAPSSRAPDAHLHTAHDNPQSAGTNQRDTLALGIAIAAILLFVATGSSVLPGAVKALVSSQQTPDHLLISALLLNIALVIFGWRRYRQLREEIAVRMAAEQHARELAEIDPLTGCMNRRSMKEAIGTVRQDATKRGQATALIMIDLDNFKQVNDMHGHQVGDTVLVEFARRLRDVLPGGVQFARLGGDEFSFALAYDPSAPERIEDLVIRIYEAMGQPVVCDTGSFKITMSIGMATDRDNADQAPCENTATLMQRADIAMYHAKKHGKNRFFWFEPSMENELRFRNELESAIRRGLDNGEFVPFYEQQIDIETGKIVGFEMLARWNSPKLGVVGPDIFIPVAEEIGVIAELSDQLMERALIDANEWSDTITLSINISPVQMRDPWFAQKLLKRLVQANFAPQRLDIEITESCLHDNVGLVRSMITSLRNQGVRVSLDDFGTGYSSLEQLRSLPFDRLKIDRSFVSELSSSDGHSRIVDAIVSLGRGMNLPITAEGIEDEQILNALKKMGDLKGQGYLYGRPEPAETVRDRLNEKGLLKEPTPASSRMAAAREKSAQEPERRSAENILKRARG